MQKAMSYFKKYMKNLALSLTLSLAKNKFYFSKNKKDQ